MNWYDGRHNDWYRPNARVRIVRRQGTEVQNAPAPPRDDGKKRTRVVAVLVCLAVLLLGVWAIASGTAGGSTVSYNTDGMPTDWHDYMEEYYDDGEVSSSDIELPLAAERGSLSILIGSGGESLEFSEIYEKCAPSVVGIMVFEDEDDSYYGWGSGVVASSDGYIITNTHVVDGGDSATVVLYDGSEYDAELIGYDTTSDIALIKIDAEGLTPAEFAESSTLSVGDPVAAIGNPLSPDLRLTMTRGIVSALNREMSYNGASMSLIQTDAAINEGNSGGPLFNDRGQVVGITNMKMISTFGDGVEGLGFAIPSDTVCAIVEALMQDGEVRGRLAVGITLGAVPEDVSDYYGIPSGLYVVGVTEGSDAEAQGIKTGDIITRVNGEDCSSNEDVTAAKEGLSAGDELTFTIWRDGSSFDVSVKLMDTADMDN